MLLRYHMLWISVDGLKQNFVRTQYFLNMSISVETSVLNKNNNCSKKVFSCGMIVFKFHYYFHILLSVYKFHKPYIALHESLKLHAFIGEIGIFHYGMCLIKLYFILLYNIHTYLQIVYSDVQKTVYIYFFTIYANSRNRGFKCITHFTNSTLRHQLSPY